MTDATHDLASHDLASHDRAPMDGPVAPARAASRQGLLLSLGGLRCALPREAVREVLPLPRLWRPPGLPRPLAGFMNLDGEAVPVLDLARLFDLPEVAGVERLYSHVLVGTDGGLALLVDRVLDLVTLPPESFCPILPGPPGLSEPPSPSGTSSLSGPPNPPEPPFLSEAPVLSEPPALPSPAVLSESPVPPKPPFSPGSPVAPGHSLNGCVVAQLELAGQPAGSLVPLLAWDRILLAQESASLQTLRHDAQRRLAEWPATG